jgi:eukaryotic-like serine/threonine-protein kinase
VRRVVSGTGTAQISISQSGVLAYLPGPAFTSAMQRQLAFLDSKGNIAPLDLPAGSYVMPRVSPNGKQLAFGTDGKEEAIWIYDLSGVSSMRRLAFGGRNRFPMWSADSQRVAFQSDREGDLGIFWQRADGNGPPERLTKADKGISHVPEVWFPGGDKFAFTEMKGSNFRLWTYSVKDRTAAPYDAIQASQPITPVFSPDGRWLAYTSTETGRGEVFVQPFPSNGTKYQISANGGHHALWTPDGKSLLWDVTSGRSEIVTINTKPVFTFGSPAVLPRGAMLFAGNESLRPIDMAPDGRILGAILVSEGPSGTGTPSEIRVVLNWFEELKQRVPLN